VIAIHQAVTEPACAVAAIEDSPEYLRNRVNRSQGIPVLASTIDAICQRLDLGKIDFLKMNIEGAERLAIRGVIETLKRTKVLCICCHDSLAEASKDDQLRTKAVVKRFLQENGLRVEQPDDPDLPPYVRDQIWGYSAQRVEKATGSSDSRQQDYRKAVSWCRRRDFPPHCSGIFQCPW
jgi:Methyltransferase FkbM domain